MQCVRKWASQHSQRPANHSCGDSVKRCLHENLGCHLPQRMRCVYSPAFPGFEKSPTSCALLGPCSQRYTRGVLYLWAEGCPGTSQVLQRSRIATTALEKTEGLSACCSCASAGWVLNSWSSTSFCLAAADSCVNCTAATLLPRQAIRACYLAAYYLLGIMSLDYSPK